MQVIGLLLLWPVSAIVRGFALQILWGWFIVTTFGMVALTIPKALGLSVVITFLTHQISNRRSNATEDHTAIEMAVSGMLWSGIALAMGWVIHLFM